MKYALHELLRVRKLREDNAVNAMLNARRQADECAGRLEQCKRELDDYMRWRAMKEEQMYADVLRRPVQGRNLDDIRVQVEIMREDELPYRQRIQEAAESLETARRELALKSETYQAAMRGREKIDEHKSIWAEQIRKEEQCAEDKELEEFRVREDEESMEGKCYGHA